MLRIGEQSLIRSAEDMRTIDDPEERRREIERNRRKRELELAKRGVFGATVDWNSITDAGILTGLDTPLQY